MRILFVCHGNICLSQHGVWFDRIICMDASNLRLIRRLIPADPQGKIRLT